MDVHELAQTLTPTRTALLFGAGASIPSGAPSGAVLARRLGRLIHLDPDEAELAEVAQLVENRKGRPALVAEVRSALKGLHPTSGLLALPNFDWLSIYTTNFDTLVEQAYLQFGRSIDVYRSNFDIGKPRTQEVTSLYKIHGCVTQDSADGHRSRMLITESDYDDFERYRQTLFNSLQGDMFTGDTVIIGQSLADRHLKELAKQVVALRAEGVNTRVFLLVHQYDADRAELYTRIGLEVVHADLDTFLLALIGAGKTRETRAYSTSSGSSLLSASLVVTTIDVTHATALETNVTKLFNGSPASYADIKQGLTISRVAQHRMRDAFKGARGYFHVVEGARGVGKTSLARAFMLELSQRGVPTWEHRPDVPLDVASWLDAEKRLREAGQDGVLLIDDCYRHLREVNKLVDALAGLDRPSLRVVVTVDAARWKVSRKSPGFFSRGSNVRLSVLERSDLDELVALLDRRPEIKQLVEQSFLHLSRGARLSRLKNKCSSEMFVCLKNIFANDNLDDLLLQEYFTLSQDAREVYRYVAAVQALGGHVHRQLILRLLGLDATSLDAVLAQLEGVVFEHVIDGGRGIFGWETRHDVIATVIARVKFADQDEIRNLFFDLINGLNPSVDIEMETAVALATEGLGIARLTSFGDQIAAYRRLIDVIPAHRTPRRRLAKLFLSRDMLPEASNEIAVAERVNGTDAVLQRYKAQVALRKSEVITLVEDSDRHAILLDALNTINSCIARYGSDLYSYKTLGEIGLSLAERYNDFSAVDDAIQLLTQYERENGDPQIQAVQRRLASRVRQLTTGEASLDGVTEDLGDDLGID
ncbi:SIR2 family protein [Curtobacterium sp. VKM Ac-1376]|uniref:SIR2 family protein n=1 Tax=Curtobacterium sp. VKM Ac-1376 TaxID=123312 RepID=UPI00188D9743|nr:SIR2 family protein [Curtobacterium sp. VKM Ac-1376]MBF4615420.1 SIR2 family protein [Curtobacterium sp. VKM Ac-1376]